MKMDTPINIQSLYQELQEDTLVVRVLVDQEDITLETVI
jgi:hypothetical protein